MNISRWTTLGVLGLSLTACASAPPTTPPPAPEEAAPKRLPSILDVMLDTGIEPEPQMKKPRIGKVTFESDVRISGPIDPEQTTRNITVRQGALLDCYERWLKQDPTLAGSLKLRVTIRPNGRVKDTHVDGTLMEEGLIARCVGSRVKGWRFPAPDDKEAIVEIDLLFAPK